MSVPPVSTTNSSTTGTSSTAQAAGPSIDYQSFLKLLMAEMKNQDPTNPMDSTQYVAQLATFSQVEQSVQTNSKLDQLLQTSALAQAGNIIGHSVTSADGNTSGTVSSVRLTSDGLVAILDTGQEVTMQSGVVIQ
ncbi:MAG: flagellar hook assembly protein FlgD [Rhizobiales bacterium]|jgi:flagellar basal-body rod modification protein FlgD|nr:flagellar hook assembly protein FlgD [Hyphomicrobiales bacterium]